MTAALVRAVAPDREVRCTREHREQVENPSRFRPAHLSPVATLERPPRAVILRSSSDFEQSLAWCQVRQPDVAQIARGIFVLRNAARGSPDRSDSRPLAADARAAQSHN